MYLAYLFPQYGGMELAPFERQFDTSVGKQVVKASSGHIPQPFLISDLKSWGKDREERWILADKFFFSQSTQRSRERNVKTTTQTGKILGFNGQNPCLFAQVFTYFMQ
jgi:hypothetical protein